MTAVNGNRYFCLERVHKIVTDWKARAREAHTQMLTARADRKRREHVRLIQDENFRRGLARQDAATERANRIAAAAGAEVIYFLRCGPYVKIGRSRQLRNRLAELKTGNPYPLDLIATIPGDKILDAALRGRFAALHHQDEWFHLRDELEIYIKDIDSKKKRRLSRSGAGMA